MAEPLRDGRNLEVYLEDVYGQLGRVRREHAEALAEGAGDLTANRACSAEIRELSAAVRETSRHLVGRAQATRLTAAALATEQDMIARNEESYAAMPSERSTA